MDHMIKMLYKQYERQVLLINLSKTEYKRGVVGGEEKDFAMRGEKMTNKSMKSYKYLGVIITNIESKDE